MGEYFSEELGEQFLNDRGRAMEILQKEAELLEIVRLIGLDALSQEERLLLEAARSIREDFLHQNAFDDVDTYSSLAKQASMLRLILLEHDACMQRLESGEPMEGLVDDPVRERIARAKYVPEEESAETYKEIAEEILRGVGRPVGGSG